MPVCLKNSRMKYAAAAVLLCLLILFLLIYNLTCRSIQNRLEQSESRLQAMAALEADYLQNRLSDMVTDIQTVQDRDALLQNVAALLMERQNEALEGEYVFTLIKDGRADERSIEYTTADTGETWYTFCMPLADSGFSVSVSSPESALLAGINRSDYIARLVTINITAAVLLLCFIVVYHLRRKQKQLQGANEKLRVSDEKFRIAISHTADIVFEYHLKSGSIRILNDCAFGENPACRQQMQRETWEQVIHPGDQTAVAELGRQIETGGREFSLIFRARTLYGEADYRWYRLTLTVIPGKNGRPGLAVGTVSDINEQQNETLTLRSKAQRDSLTGLLNREECENRVERLLSDNRWNGGAFLLIDLDRFKSLNDNLGHMTGDRALRMLAAVFRQVFRESDVMGRMGGDEFMVLLRDVTEPGMVEQKLSELRQALLLSNNGGDTLPDLQLSVGVVFAGKQDHFQDLYNMADIALYRAKNGGGNRNIFYQRKEEPVSCV